MRERTLSFLRRYGRGEIGKMPVWLIFGALVLGIALVALIPIYPIWALQLLGFPVVVTFKSYTGSLLMILFYLWIRGLSRKSTQPV
jgi:hypothetical protein